MYRLIVLRLSVFAVALTFIACSKHDVKPKVSWQQLKDFPGEGRGSAIAFSLSGKGYWGMGENLTGDLKDFWMYDPANDSWEQKKDFPFDLPVEVAVTIDTKAYVVTYSGAVYEYDATLDSWTYRTNFPAGSRPQLAGFALNGKAYFGTGNNTDVDNFHVYNDFWQYDPVLNEWKAIADFPGVARTGAISFTIGSAGYIGLGSNGEGSPPIYTDIWRYDPTADNWTEIAQFPDSTSLVGIVFSNKSAAFVGVTKNTQAHPVQMHEYLPASNSWTTVETFPDIHSLDTSSFVINEKMYVIGGWLSEYSNKVWEFFQ
jgi:N-acetylneuraminic acid mutarotase